MASIWMLLAMFLFSIMGACVKLAGDQYNFFELVAYRGLIGTLFIAGFARWQSGAWRNLKTTLPWMHLWRAVVGVTSLCLWFYSFYGLPLPTAVTLNATAPIWVAAILMSTTFLLTSNANKQPSFQWQLALAIVVSFAGVALLLKPTISQDQLSYGLIGLLSGLISALAYLQVAALGKAGEPEYRVVFYFSVGSLLAGSMGALFLGHHAHTLRGIGLLLVIGISASLAQLALTRAYTLGHALVTANLQYTGILFSSALGWLLFGDALDALGWLGIVLIVLSGVVATIYRTRSSSALPQARSSVME
jgi:S-adenosylmethionine uptake transporter